MPTSISGGTGGNSAGGEAALRDEWVLKPTEEYIIEVTNIAGNVQPCSLNVEYYEHSSVK